MDPYAILAQSAHKVNPLKRYQLFLESCKQYNDRYGFENDYFEKHHIIPASVNANYQNLNQCKWNRIDLSPRQHFIAHMILAKLFLSSNNKYSMLTALIHMISSKSEKYNSKLYSKFRLEYSLKTSERITLSNQGRTWINKDQSRKYVKPEDLRSYLDDGWEIGMNIDRSGDKNPMYNKVRKDTYTKSTLEKMSKSMIGKNSCRISCFGKHYDSVQSAQDDYPGISIRKRIDNDKYPDFFRLDPKTVRTKSIS